MTFLLPGNILNFKLISLSFCHLSMIFLSIFLPSSSQTIILLSVLFLCLLFAMLVVEFRDSSILGKHCISKLFPKNFSKFVQITMLSLW